MTFEAPILDFFVHHRVAWLDAVMIGITRLGEDPVLFLVVALSGLWLGARTRGWQASIRLAAAFGGSLSADLSIKQVLCRARPESSLMVMAVSGCAFPSGHATHATAVYCTLGCLVSRIISPRFSPVALGAGIVLSGLIGLSRLYLGVHWALDVVGGWMLGSLVAFLAVRGMNTP